MAARSGNNGHFMGKAPRDKSERLHGHRQRGTEPKRTGSAEQERLDGQRLTRSPLGGESSWTRHAADLSRAVGDKQPARRQTIPRSRQMAALIGVVRMTVKTLTVERVTG